MLHLLRIALIVFLGFQSGEVKPGSDIPGFTLDETQAELARQLGTPDGVDDSLPNYVSWMFKAGAQDEHDFGYVLCFRRSDYKLISITRNFEPEVNVDHLFPDDGSTVRNWPSDEKPQFSVRVRSLPGNRVLLAMGSGATGKLCGQVILMDRDALKVFFPWLSGN